MLTMEKSTIDMGPVFFFFYRGWCFYDMGYRYGGTMRRKLRCIQKCSHFKKLHHFDSDTFSSTVDFLSFRFPASFPLLSRV